jgi:DNA-binding transcriptional MerR regulator
MSSIENQSLSKLYYSIGEVAQMLNVNASLLRFWEKEFKLKVSKKNAKGNRLFSVKEITQLKQIYQYVKIEGYTLEGAKKALKQKGNPLHDSTDSSVILTAEATGKADHAQVIQRLESIKEKLVSLSTQIKTEPISSTTNSNFAESTAIPYQTPTTAAPKKRNSERPKPTSDMPTLFDF